MRKTVLLAVVFLMVGFVSYAAGAPDVRLSTNRSTQAIVNEVATQKGFFKEQGIDVKVFAESSGSASLMAVVGGSADMGVGLHSRVLQVLAKGLPLCVIGMVQYGLTSKILVPIRDKTSKTMADLKGKRLAIQVGSGTYVAWRILLKYIGLKEKDFVVKNLKTRMIPATFESGSIDVAVAWEPYASILVSKGLARVLITNDEWSKIGKIVYPVFLYANCNWVKKNKAITQKFVNAWIKAIKFVNTNKKETVDIMARAYKGWGLTIPRDKVKAGIYTRGYDKLTVDDDVMTDTMNFAQTMYDIKKIKFIPDFKKALMLEFTNKALGIK
jgi:NitT/TauT family transport system substrate-binding protein/sulfonate transport system substrate-binding protein